MGYCPKGCKLSDMNEVLSTQEEAVLPVCLLLIISTLTTVTGT